MKDFFTPIYQSTRHSLNGMCQAFKTERSFRLEVFLSLPLLLILIFGSFTAIERLVLLFPILGTFSCELLNSGIEKTIDELGKGAIRQNFKYAKDCGSAAVFFMLLMTVLVWLMVALPRLVAS
jgi:diacylglycerol kinase (ATP)